MTDLSGPLALQLRDLELPVARREQDELIGRHRFCADSLPRCVQPRHRWCAVYVGAELYAGFVLDVERSRRLPWARLVRWEGLGRENFSFMESQLPRILSALGTIVPNVLRVNIGLREFLPERRALLIAMLKASGYVPVSPRDYVDTLLLPLDQHGEPEQGFSSSTRRNLREARRAGLTVRRVIDAADLEQIRAVVAEAFARRDAGVVIPSPESLRADLDATHVALFAASLPGHDQIIACARFRRVGDLGIYEIAGSRRDTTLGRLPVAPLLVREGIEWARATGCRWMDFGGVPTEVGTSLDGIAAFKAGFGGTRTTIGGEWSLRPSPRLSKLEDLVGRFR
ncbi:MAG TPA: GNAT family N-acetyltransferase [Gemmatimonas sp.]|uniref:GNAT family N-acetyltransferase n=1 Tax=Gemmatimonas sp. TaxID=1962908 RepID=UPI002ED7AD5E